MYAIAADFRGVTGGSCIMLFSTGLPLGNSVIFNTPKIHSLSILLLYARRPSAYTFRTIYIDYRLLLLGEEAGNR